MTHDHLIYSDDPITGSGPILPPVIDDLVEYLDVGISASWDNAGEDFIDQAAAQGLNNYDRQAAAALAFVGTPDNREYDTHFLLSTPAAIPHFNAVNPRSDVGDIYFSSFGPWTLIFVAEIPTGASAGKLVGSGNATSDFGFEYALSAAGIEYTARADATTEVFQAYDFGTPWSLPAEVKVITMIGDSNIAGVGSVKISGFSKILGPTDYAAGTTVSINNQILSDAASEQLPANLKFWAFCYYKRALSDSEVTQVENYFLDVLAPSGIVNGGWAVENLSLPGLDGTNPWHLYELAPHIAGVPQTDFIGNSLKDPWSNVANVTGAAFNSNAVSDNAISVSRQARFGLLFDHSVNADQIGLYHDPVFESPSKPARQMIMSTDDAGMNWTDIMAITAFAGKLPADTDDTFILYDIPGPELDGFSANVRGMLVKYKNLTTLERTSLGTFLTTLDTNGILQFVIEFYPLFLTDEVDSRTAGIRSPALTASGTAAHVPGEGWNFPVIGDYLDTGETTEVMLSNPFDVDAVAGKRSMGGVIYMNSGTVEGVLNALWGSGLFADQVFSEYNNNFGGQIRSTLLTQAARNTGVVGVLPVKIPISVFRDETTHYSRIGAGGLNSVGTQSESANLPTVSMRFPGFNSNGTLSNSFVSLYSFFMLYDMNDLTTDDTLTINNAVQQLIDDMGIV